MTGIFFVVGATAFVLGYIVGDAARSWIDHRTVKNVLAILEHIEMLGRYERRDGQ